MASWEQLPSEEEFKQLSGALLKNAFESFANEKDNKALILWMTTLGLMIILGGAEVVKIIFRKNFGSNGVDFYKSLFSTIVFIIIAVICYNHYIDYDEAAVAIGSKLSFLITTIFYAILAVFVLVKAVKVIQKKEDSVFPTYRGDSNLLSFLLEAKWQPAMIQNFAEPLFLFAVGVFLTPINYYLGLPLALSALSFWLYYFYERVVGLGRARNALSNLKGTLVSDDKTFSKVI